MALIIGRFVGQKTIIVVPPSAESTIIIAEAHDPRGTRQDKTRWTAPRHVQIDREEIYLRKQGEIRGAMADGTVKVK